MLHAALDRAVWDAYRWDDADPAATDDATVLPRLLSLNRERAATDYKEHRVGAAPADAIAVGDAVRPVSGDS